MRPRSGKNPLFEYTYIQHLHFEPCKSHSKVIFQIIYINVNSAVTLKIINVENLSLLVLNCVLLLETCHKINLISYMDKYKLAKTFKNI